VKQHCIHAQDQADLSSLTADVSPVHYHGMCSRPAHFLQ